MRCRSCAGQARSRPRPARRECRCRRAGARVAPASHQARRQILQACQLDLQLAFVALRHARRRSRGSASVRSATATPGGARVTLLRRPCAWSGQRHLGMAETSALIVGLARTDEQRRVRRLAAADDTLDGVAGRSASWASSSRLASKWPLPKSTRPGSALAARRDCRPGVQPFPPAGVASRRASSSPRAASRPRGVDRTAGTTVGSRLQTICVTVLRNL